MGSSLQPGELPLLMQAVSMSDQEIPVVEPPVLRVGGRERASQSQATESEQDMFLPQCLSASCPRCSSCQPLGALCPPGAIKEASQGPPLASWKKWSHLAKINSRATATVSWGKSWQDQAGSTVRLGFPGAGEMQEDG